MKLQRSIVAGSALLIAAAAAGQTPAPGAKALGMGGTFVASGSDATALWGNPADLSRCLLGCGVTFGAAVATDENAFARTLQDDFSGVDLATLSDPAQIAKLQGDLRSLSRSGTGAIGSGSAGLGYALRGFGIGIGETIYAGAYPQVDFVAAGGVEVPSLASRVFLRGIEARELRVGYAGAFFGFTLGADVRYIQGRTYVADESLTDAAHTSWTILRDALEQNERRTNRFGVDLGATYSLAGKLRLGIVGENLNAPKFDAADGSSIELPRTVRVGAAFAPVSFDGIVFAVDADVNKQKTLVPGLSSRRIAAGAQIYVVRIGAYRDLEAVDPHWAYTAGVQLPLHFLAIGISGSYSAHKGDLGLAADLKIKL